MWQMLLSSTSRVAAQIAPAILIRAFSSPSQVLIGPGILLRAIPPVTFNNVGPAILLRAFKE